MELQQKKHHLYSCTSMDMSNNGKKLTKKETTLAQAYKCIFRPDGCYQKSVLEMISATHTTNRQSFKKVTCAFKSSSDFLKLNYCKKYQARIQVT